MQTDIITRFETGRERQPRLRRSALASGRQKAEGTMEKKRLDQLRRKLQQKQMELTRTVTRTEQDGRLADEEATQDIADKAINSYTKEFLFHQSNADRHMLQMVNEALQRIHDGSYGQCVTCGSELNAKRIEAVPWARYCISCQEKAEQGVLR